MVQAAPRERTEDAGRRMSRGQRWVLALVSAAQLLLQLDFSIVNEALPAIQADLGFSDAGLQWTVTGYALTYGSLLLLGGGLGDLFGHRRLLVLGLVVFAAASLLGGLAGHPAVLVTARLVQGAGAALIAPAALATLTGTFELDRQRAHALGIFQAATAGGATAGIVLGGVLVELLGWRSVLLVNPPVIVLLVVLVRWRVPRPVTSQGGAGLDVTGAVLVTGTLAALVSAMSQGERAGFGAPSTLGLLAAAGVLGVALVVAQRRSAHPMLPPNLFRSQTRVGVLVVVAVEFAVVVGYVYFISQYLQRVAGFSAIVTGLSLVPATATVMLTSVLLSPHLLPRLGVRSQLAAGLGLVALGQLVLSLLTPTSPYAQVVLPGLLLTAVGMGLSIPAAAFAATSDVPPGLRGTAGGLLVTAQQAGAAVGLAVLAVVAVPAGTGVDALTAGFDRAYLLSAALALAATLTALLLVPARRRPHRPPGPGRARRTRHGG